MEVAGFGVLVPVHANCHRADLGWREVRDEGHAFVPTVSEGMQQAAAFFNHAPAWLHLLRQVAEMLELCMRKFGTLKDKRWAAFAKGACRVWD